MRTDDLEAADVDGPARGLLDLLIRLDDHLPGRRGDHPLPAHLPVGVPLDQHARPLEPQPLHDELGFRPAETPFRDRGGRDFENPIALAHDGQVFQGILEIVDAGTYRAVRRRDRVVKAARQLTALDRESEVGFQQGPEVLQVQLFEPHVPFEPERLHRDAPGGADDTRSGQADGDLLGSLAFGDRADFGELEHGRPKGHLQRFVARLVLDFDRGPADFDVLEQDSGQARLRIGRASMRGLPPPDLLDHLGQIDPAVREAPRPEDGVLHAELAQGRRPAKEAGELRVGIDLVGREEYGPRAIGDGQAFDRERKSEGVETNRSDGGREACPLPEVFDQEIPDDGWDDQDADNQPGDPQAEQGCAPAP